MYKSYATIYKSELIKHDYIYFIRYVNRLKRPKVLRSINPKSFSHMDYMDQLDPYCRRCTVFSFHKSFHKSARKYMYNIYMYL